MTEKRTMKELRAEAKERGINTFQMSKATLIKALGQPKAEETNDGGDQGLNPRAERPTTREETGRRARVPLGDPRPKMAAPERMGYRRRWINDTGDRLRAASTAGYEFVEDEIEVDEAGRGKRRSMTVGTKEDGSPLKAFLMEIRNEFYEVDQAVKQGKIDEVDAAMRRGEVHGAQPQDEDKYYVPDEGISVRS
jgi:hypothetical protein